MPAIMKEVHMLKLNVYNYWHHFPYIFFLQCAKEKLILVC